MIVYNYFKRDKAIMEFVASNLLYRKSGKTHKKCIFTCTAVLYFTITEILFNVNLKNIFKKTYEYYEYV